LRLQDVLCEHGCLCVELRCRIDCFLMHATAEVSSVVVFNVVDLYNSGTGLWSTAWLSQARRGLAATSVGSVAIFFGGIPQGKLLMIAFGCRVRDCCLRL
jgi:hypothetical protein